MQQLIGLSVCLPQTPDYEAVYNQSGTGSSCMLSAACTLQCCCQGLHHVCAQGHVNADDSQQHTRQR